MRLKFSALLICSLVSSASTGYTWQIFRQRFSARDRPVSRQLCSLILAGEVREVGETGKAGDAAPPNFSSNRSSQFQRLKPNCVPLCSPWSRTQTFATPQPRPCLLSSFLNDSRRSDDVIPSGDRHRGAVVRLYRRRSWPGRFHKRLLPWSRPRGHTRSIIHPHDPRDNLVDTRDHPSPGPSPPCSLQGEC